MPLKFTTITAGEKVVFDSITTTQAIFYSSGGNISIGFGNFTGTGYLANTDFTLYSILHNGSNSNAFVDSSTQILTNQNLGTNAFNGLRIGAVRGTGAGAFFNGNIPELIVYSGSQAANRTYIENNINAYYDIYTTSSTSTENAYVSTWYDQSGNGNHATQTTASYQPLIVSSGSLITENGKPAVKFNGTSTNLKSGIFPTSPLPYTTFTAVKFDSFTAFNFVVSHGNGIGVIASYNPGSGQTFLAKNNVNLFGGGTAATNTPYLIYGLFNGANSEIASNGNTVTTGSTGGSTWSTITIGSDTDNEAGTFINGTISEHLEYYANQSANRPLIENNINNYYNIYTGSNHGFVERWYDQSGNNRHAVQTTAGSQPIIVESGSVIFENSKPALSFDGTAHTLSSSFGTTIAQPVSIFSIYKPDITGSIHPIYDGTGARITHWVGGNKYNTFAGVDLLGVQTATLDQVLHTGIYNGGSSLSNINSVLDRSGNAGTNGTSGIRIGGWYNLTYFFTGKIQELVMYPSNQSSVVAPVEYGINDYYNIYTQPTSSNWTTSSFTIKADSTSISGSLNNKLTSGIQSSGPLGLVTVSRTGSDSLTIARNGAATSFSVPASGALSTGLYLGAINNNGTALGNSPYSISFASVGTGLTNSETGVLSTLVSRLQINLNRSLPILNQFPDDNILAAVSLRLLNSSYTGPAITIRRASDSATLDVGFINRQLDTATISTFLNGGTGYVTTWYDQSGNENHFTQGNVNLQPIFKFTSNNKFGTSSYPTIEFNSDSLTLGTFTSGAYSIFMLNKINTFKSLNYFAGNNAIHLGWRSTNTLTIAHVSNDANFGYTGTSNPLLHTLIYKSPGSQYWVNNSSIGANATIPTGPSGITTSLSLGTGYSQYFLGDIQEVLVYASDKTADVTQINTNINNYYQIY